jgi:hypothetical protein
MTARVAIPAVLLAALLGACSHQDPAHNAYNELPFGNIDTPLEGTRVQAKVDVAGWAMDDHGLREIRLYVDGRFAGLAPLKQERTDVKHTYTRYARFGEKNGWVGTVVFDQPGAHAILVQATDIDGGTRDIGVVHVTAADR